MINIMQKQKIIDFPKQYLNGRMQNVISKKIINCSQYSETK